ncbi:sugar phosphate isomerase/epimerase family protein [Streptomyces sp. NPDC048566]|uniref:sugar phosphate isomerase/epimerase family protein n=1 Tax=Streptomyces sp. NPDC048566 TaxID=3365569 RepID=UPI003718418E
MRLAFSTLGVPGLPVADVVRLAGAHGFRGVEVRAHPEEPVHPGIGRAERASVKAEFTAGGITLVGVAGYARVAAPGDDAPVLRELRDLVELAADLDAPFVRVFPGAAPGADTAEADAAAVRRLGAAAEHAAARGVRVLLETHDSHRTGADALRVLGRVGHRHVGALWDVMHTWLGGEDPARTGPALSPYLGYTQVKDIASAADTTPLPLGSGVVPLGACVDALARAGWDGWLCWEYEKRWYPQAAPLEGLLGAGREYLEGLLKAARPGG